jgi:hypothetical protein
MATSREWLHIAWMDAHSGPQRVYYGRARLADLKFDVQELNAPGPGTQGNARLLLDAAGRLHAVWEESLGHEPLQADPHESRDPRDQHHGPTAGAGRVIMYAGSPRADGRFDAARPIAARAGRFQTRPAIASAADGQLVVAWNELDERGKRVVIQRFGDTQLEP